MPRQRNLLPLAGFLLCGISLLSYPLFFAQFPVTRDVPWVNWLLFVLGLGMAGVGIARAFRQPERYRGRVAGPIFGVLSLAVLGLFLFMTLSFARQLPQSAGAPKVGEKAPDFTLPDAQGKPVRLNSLLEQPGAPGSWVVLVFYRPVTPSDGVSRNGSPNSRLAASGRSRSASIRPRPLASTSRRWAGHSRS